jgi:FKBP-type peptidyl-prolyl cis-trans isomerase
MKPIKLVLTVLTLIASVTYADNESASPSTMVTTASGLQYTDDAVGDGELAKAGDTVSVQYTGWIQKADGGKGLMFDTSRDIGRPFEFRLGRRKVIAGWEEGISGMRVGGKRTLVVPSALAYGKRGLGAIVLPNQNLIFEVELVGLRAR